MTRDEAARARAETVALREAGHTQRQIACLLGVTEHCVRMRLQRAGSTARGVARLTRQSPGPIRKSPTGGRMHRWRAHECERCGCGTDPEVWPLAGQSCPGGVA